jgi:DNA-binding Xre family transcriptional regulator
MSMKLIVRDVAEREGFKNANELAVKTGIPLFSMYRIWDGRAKMIALETMDRLCTVLKVKPGQLFEHEAEPDKLPGSDTGQAESTKARRTSSKQKGSPKQARAAVIGG